MKHPTPLSDISHIDLDKSIFIEASAGTGKTYTITRLFLRYVLEKEVDFRNIILLTFTKKATEEMLTRIRELIQNALLKKELDFIKNQKLNKKQLETLNDILNYFDQLRIATIHSFCKSLINEYPFELNLPSNIELLTDNSEIINDILLNLIINNNNITIYQHLKKVLSQLNFSILNQYIHRFISEANKRENFILNFLEEQISFKDILENFDTEKEHLNLSKDLIIVMKYVYEELNHYKKFNGKFTYDDIIIHLYNALKNNLSFRKTMQDKFQIGIIDEFQDTDPYQWQIFSWIFLESSKNKLVVVGDPKQSIYGFRGADIYTYIKAKNELKYANFYTLTNNFRSTKEFIQNINLYFKSCLNHNSIETIKNNVEYIDIHSRIEIPEFHLQDIYQQYAPINFIELDTNKHVDELRLEYAKKITAIIIEMIQKKYKIYAGEKEKIKTIAFSDIAILTRSYEDIKYILQEFKKNEIPFTDHSKLSIFQTLESYTIQLLLEYFADPQNPVNKKQFITYYFLDVPYTNIETIENLYPEILQKLSYWNELLEKRNWYTLFYKIIEDTRLYYKYLALPDYERKITNFEHLIEILVELATKNHLGSLELYKEFMYLKETSNREELYYQRLESQENKVQILTMHSSKGLEFPVVFLSGWYNKNQISVGDSDNYKFYSQNSNYDKIWNICFFKLTETKDEDLKNRIRSEALFEDFRLLYVACTRARTFLFLPFYKLSPKNEKKYSMSLFLSNIPDEFPIIREIKTINTSSVAFNTNKEENTSTNSYKDIHSLIEKIEVLENIPYEKKRYQLNSYSSLTKNQLSILDEMDYDETFLFEEELIKKPTEFDMFFKPGTNTGNFIHKIFEKIDFYDFKDTLTNEKKNNLIQKYKGLFKYYNLIYSIYDEKESEIFFNFFIDFIYKIINIKINHKFSLADLKEDLIKKEISFLIQDLSMISGFEPIMNNNFFTGTMDLFFEHEENYYLLDYKTTLQPSYDFETLKAYTEKEYKVQYLIYSYALYLWLKNIKKDFSLEKKLPGGIIYFYLRGYMQESKGIFYREFDTFTDIYHQLKQILNKNSKI